jgi:hypothetical protein
MAGKCSQSSCYPDTGCNIEGCSDVTKCKWYNKSETVEEESVVLDSDYTKIAWTGNAFGLTDLNFLTASSKPIIIGITGSASAGKTTFLASLYCLLRNGHQIGNYSFAGSLTLNGWEDISWYLSWTNKGDIQFPPHTTNNAGRVPGLLHLALRNGNDEKIDLIFTDAPGEWFDHWRTNANNENAKGAKWIHSNSDAYLLFADCEMLASQKRGLVKGQITSVADRIFENIKNKPFGLVWSKSDIQISDTTKEHIVSHIKQISCLHYNEFLTSVNAGIDGMFHKNILESISWIIECVTTNINRTPLINSIAPTDMFLSKRILS